MTQKVVPPSGITLHEQMVMWALMALDEACPTQAIQERPNLISFNSETQVIKTPSGQLVFIGRVVLPIDEYSTLPAGSKPWIAAQSIAQSTAIPAYYTAN